MHFRAGLAALAVVLGFATNANAALTSSERGQIRDYFARGEAQNAGRVRALVARTDLTADESIAALTEAVVAVPFTDNRAVFLREMTFGVASAASRPLLVSAVVHALDSRADAVFQKAGGGLDRDANAVAELSAIYTFIDSAIANGPAQTDASDAFAKHLEANPRWLKGDGAIPEAAARVRAQAQVTMFDLLPEGTTRNVTAADRLGVAGARRQMLIEWGVLLEDSGNVDADKVRQVLVRMPAARSSVELLWAGSGVVRAKGGVATVALRGDEHPFGNEVTPLTVDATTSGLTQDLATLAVSRALAGTPQLRTLAQQDAVATQGDPGKILGKARAPSADHVLGAAAQLLLLDAPRAIDLAFVRTLGGRPESAALLCDAIGALSGTETSLEVGKTKLTAIRRSGAAVTGFTNDKHVWSIDRFAPTYAVTTVTRDAQPLSLAMLPNAKTPLEDGTSWTDGKLTLTRLRGSPRVGLAPTEKGSTTIKVAGLGLVGYDVVTLPAPGDDFTLEADLYVLNPAGGIAFRTLKVHDSMHGAVFMVNPGSRAAVVTLDETGESTLGNAIEPAPALPIHVRITVKGQKVEVVAGGKTVTATLPAGFTRGDLGVVAKRGSQVDVASLVTTKK